MITLDQYIQLASKIIHEQELVIGPLAYTQARKVAGLQVDEQGNITLSGNGNVVVTGLVGKFQELFGDASVEVCKDAAREIKPQIPTEELPEILR